MSVGAAVGGQGMSETDKKVCMVEDMTDLSPLAEAYARARGKEGVIRKCIHQWLNGYSI